MIRRPPRSPLFPYPTLSRSRSEVTAFRLELKERLEALEAVKTDLAVLRDEARRARTSLAGPFLSSPPTGTDRGAPRRAGRDRKSTRLNSSHQIISSSDFFFK